MSAGMEVVVDKCVRGEKILSLPGRFEPLHLPFSLSGWAMRVFGPIIQIAALPVLDVRKQLTLSDAIAPQFVGYDHPGCGVQVLQQAFEEALCSGGIAPGLNENIKDNAILIDGAPQIVLHALDPDEDLVQVPLVPGRGRRRRRRSAKLAANFLHQRRTVS
jgi:hypothetical protein